MYEVDLNINEELQQFRVENIIRQDIILKKINLLLKGHLFFHEEHQYNHIIKNIRRNSVPNIYHCLAILLQEKDIDKSNLYKNLYKYRYKQTEQNPRVTVTTHGDIQLFLPKSQVPIDVLMHEMNHLAVAFQRENKDGLLGGFCVSNQKERVINGMGMDEAFTQYLTLEQVNGGKILCCSHDSCHTFYPTGAVAAKILSNIIGFDQMKKMYYKSQPYQLYSILAKSMGKSRTLDFYDHMDQLNQLEKNIDPIPTALIDHLNNFFIELSIKQGKNNNQSDNWNCIIMDRDTFTQEVPKQVVMEAKQYEMKANGGGKK